MSPDQEEKIKSKLIQKIVGAVSFAEIVKILHELATREVDYQLSESTEEQKDELYKELFESPKNDSSNLSELSTGEVDAQ